MIENNKKNTKPQRLGIFLNPLLLALLLTRKHMAAIQAGLLAYGSSKLLGPASRWHKKKFLPDYSGATASFQDIK
jgi:hypothetical protein